MLNPVTNEMCYAVAQSAISIAAAIRDVATRRIPNRLTGASAVLGLAMHWLLEGTRGLGSSAMAGIVLGSLFLILYVAGGMGAGDVKLMAAVGCISGMQSLQMTLSATLICGMLFALSIAIYHRQFRHTIANTLLLLQHHHQRGLRHHAELNIRSAEALNLPFAVPIAAGCLISLGIEMAR